MKANRRQAVRRNSLLTIAAVASVGLAALFLWLSLLPFGTLQAALDGLAADGSLESFTPLAHQVLKTGLRGLAGLLLAISGFIFLAPRRARTVLQVASREIRGIFLDWPRDAVTALRELPRRLLRKDILVPTAVFTLLAVFARILYLNDPMYHDEAYSFVVFAKLPLRLAVADYHFPNNHLFNTLLTHINQRLFGNDPWVVRLAAFTAGVALVPAGSMLARQFYGRTASWIAGAALAAAPVLVSYSTNGRGYSWMALCTILLFVLAVELSRRSNLFYWTLAAVIAALGFYSLPVYLMPFSLVLVWLIMCGLRTGVVPQEARAAWYFRLAYYAGLSAILTLLLYLPVFRYSGISAVVANPYVESLSWQEFWPTFGSRLEDIAFEWTRNTPDFAVVVAALGMILSTVSHRRISRHPVSGQLAAAIAIPLILLAQRPNPWAKIWQFLFPLLLIWSAGGLVGGLGWLEDRLKTRFPIVRVGTALLVFMLVALAGINAVRDHPGLRSRIGPVEQGAIYFSKELREGDIVVIAPIEDAPLWYYFYKYDLSQEYFRRDIPFQRAFVVVDRSQSQTLSQVLEYRGPDRGFLRMDTARKAASWGELDLYVIDANLNAVSKAYGLEAP